MATVSLHLLIFADVGTAFNGITKLFSGYLGPILAFVLLVAGYQYMFALDDHSKASQAKRAIGVGVVGAIVVALAFDLGPKLVGLIGH